MSSNTSFNFHLLDVPSSAHYCYSAYLVWWSSICILEAQGLCKVLTQPARLSHLSSAQLRTRNPLILLSVPSHRVKTWQFLKAPLAILSSYPSFTNHHQSYGTVCDVGNPCMSRLLVKVGYHDTEVRNTPISMVNFFPRQLNLPIREVVGNSAFHHGGVLERKDDVSLGELRSQG
jgi:hypothetical protein